ncbi:MAG: hypothetical protein WDM87_12615 [Terracidiphilus sp.]
MAGTGNADGAIVERPRASAEQLRGGAMAAAGKRSNNRVAHVLDCQIIWRADFRLGRYCQALLL